MVKFTVAWAQVHNDYLSRFAQWLLVQIPTSTRDASSYAFFRSMIMVSSYHEGHAWWLIFNSDQIGTKLELYRRKNWFTWGQFPWVHYFLNFLYNIYSLKEVRIFQGWQIFVVDFHVYCSQLFFECIGSYYLCSILTGTFTLMFSTGPTDRPITIRITAPPSDRNVPPALPRWRVNTGTSSSVISVWMKATAYYLINPRLCN